MFKEARKDLEVKFGIFTRNFHRVNVTKLMEVLFLNVGNIFEDQYREARDKIEEASRNQYSDRKSAEIIKNRAYKAFSELNKEKTGEFGEIFNDDMEYAINRIPQHTSEDDERLEQIFIKVHTFCVNQSRMILLEQQNILDAMNAVGNRKQPVNRSESVSYILSDLEKVSVFSNSRLATFPPNARKLSRISANT